MMGDQITTFSKVLTHPFNVAFTCEHCGEQNSFTQEIAGVGKKALYGSTAKTFTTNDLSPAVQAKMLQKAQNQLDQGIKDAEAKIAKEKYSWLYANKCAKCNRFQSWQTGQIWKNFFKTFFGGPFILMLVVYFPLTIFWGRDSSKYPEWIMYSLSVIMLIIWISAIVILIKSLARRDHKHRNKPTVTL